MWTAATALVCALAALNRTEATFPPIKIIDTAPPFVSVGTEAFVDRTSGTIVLIASTVVMRDAARPHGECGDMFAVKKLASILIHEEWHLRNGPDEKKAYERQLVSLIQLGLGPGSAPYRDVQKAMQIVLAVQRRNKPELVLARR